MPSLTPGLDHGEHFDAVKALIDTRLQADGGTATTYGYGRVPGADGNAGDLPQVYVLLSIERRPVGILRGGHAGRSGWRVTARAVGSSDAQAKWALSRCDTALDEQTIIVDSETSTRMAFESSTSVIPDDGMYSASTTYTYAL